MTTPVAIPVRLKAPGEPLDRLIGLALASIDRATSRLEGGGAVTRWRRDMERAIATAHQAAFIAATAEWLGVPPDSPLMSRARLSRAEKADIRRAVDAQLAYLDGFVRAVEAGELTPGAIRARANMYGRAIRPFYSQQRWGDWEIPDALLPGNQRCLSNCTCRISVEDNGDGTGTLTRELGATEQHCDECPPLAGEYEVMRRQR